MMQTTAGFPEHYLEFVSSTVAQSFGTGNISIAIPSGQVLARAGDLAILCHGYTSGGTTITNNPTLPAGFTLIAQSVAVTSAGVGIQSAYKILAAADIGATVTGTPSVNAIAAGSGMILMIFRSAKIISSITVSGSAQTQATTAAPTNQTCPGGSGPMLQIAHWLATSVVTSRSATGGGTFTEVAGGSTRHYAQYCITNAVGASVSAATVSTTDVGTNGMQCFSYNIV